MNTPEIKRLLEHVKQIILSQAATDEKLLQICHLLKEEVYHYDWVGFYILAKGANSLYLGPYVGDPTDHVSIPVGIGVCGQVAEKNETMVVQDVSQLENYLSCSLSVQSEIVVPINKDGKFVAQIDIDSKSPSPFTNADSELLEEICNIVSVLF